MKRRAPLIPVITASLLLAAAVPVCAAPPAGAAGKFLAELDAPEAARHAILEKLAEVSPGSAKYTVTAESGGAVYGFSAERAPEDKDDDVRLELEGAAQAANAMGARRALLVYLNRKEMDRERYRYGDALGHALSSHYAGVAGIQSASGVTEGWVISLAWLGGAGVPRAKPGDIEDGYCAFLYKEAAGLLDAGRYADALPIFKHIHDHRWGNIGAYLGASECFLKNGEPGECKKLLSELVATLGEKMTPDDFARAGRLFRESGDRASALNAFKTARERYHEGR
jgi:hypothetical protein